MGQIQIHIPDLINMLRENRKIIVRTDRHISDFKWVKRTWMERLFERPWNPLRSKRAVLSPVGVMVGDKICLVSPRSYEVLKKHKIIAGYNG